MARPVKTKLCEACKREVGNEYNVICFYPYDEKNDDRAHAQPFICLCDECYLQAKEAIKLFFGKVFNYD